GDEARPQQDAAEARRHGLAGAALRPRRLRRGLLCGRDGGRPLRARHGRRARALALLALRHGYAAVRRSTTIPGRNPRIPRADGRGPPSGPSRGLPPPSPASPAPTRGRPPPPPPAAITSAGGEARWSSMFIDTCAMPASGR